MVKTTLYSTTKVLPGNKIEIQTPSLLVGQTVKVKVIILVLPEATSSFRIFALTKVLPGNKIEIQDPSLLVGQTVNVVKVIILVLQEATSSSVEKQSLSLEQRLAFLKLPMTERRRILENQAETMLNHYQQDSEWQELMSGDIINY
jgi:hypothetical protein